MWGMKKFLKFVIGFWHFLPGLTLRMKRSAIFRQLITRNHEFPRQVGAWLFAAAFLAQQVQAGPPAMPPGGSFGAGTGSIAAAGKAVTITQSSLRGIIDWKS